MSAIDDEKKADGLKGIIEAYERDVITDALRITFGNQSRAARLLGTSRRVIHYKVQKYALDLKHFRLLRLGQQKDMKKSAPGNIADGPPYGREEPP